MKKVVVYTAIFGKYDALVEQKKNPNVDFICFTDRNLKSNTWKIVIVDPLPMGEDYTRNNRFYKILPHIHFPDYEYSIYIDGNMIIKTDIDFLINKFLSHQFSMACFDHNQTVLDPRNCIYQEYKAILELGKKKGKYKDNITVMNNWIDFLKSEKYPEHNGLLFASVLIRKHHDQNLKKVMEDWWYCVKNYSKRDQLSFNYVAWKNNFVPNTIPGDIRKRNKYVYMLGKHKKNYTYEILKFKIRDFLGIYNK